MSKELEAFGLVKRTCELYIQSKTYLIGSDIIENQINEALDTIKNRLEAIEKGKNTDIIDNYMAFKNDNVESSEALECLEKVNDYLNDVYDYKENIEEVKKDIDTIKQALLKQQEPKQYLKWEDLEKFEEQKDFFALLNGNKYTLCRYRDSRNKYVMVNLNEINIATLCDMFKQDIDFFNDLHLEVVEE